METWLRLDCRCLCREAEQAARIAAERIGEMTGSGRAELRLTFSETETEGYVIEVAAPFEVRIGANRSRNFIAGLGELLRLLLASADEAGAFGSGARSASSPEPAWPGLPAGRKEYIPAVKERIHYLPGHFGNSFEVCWEGEMRRYLEDLALSGASGYGDWFDPNDMPDPYHPHVFHSSSMFLWRRKKGWLKISQELGLDNVLVVTPNIGFVDQMRPEWVGVRDHKLRVQGQVLCPSNPEARQVILNNHRQLFEDLAQSGIRIGKIVCAPYDDGGCACPKCQPYYPVFLKLVHDVYEAARPSFPELKADICGWWTSEEESAHLREFALGPARDWFGAYQLSAAYDVRALDAGVRSRIGDMKLGCFLHIGFSRDRRDVYTQTGVHSAARRLQSVIGSFSLPNCESFMTYNESFGDHYNAFVAGLLGYDPQRDAREIALFYGRLVLGLGGDRLRTFADVLLEMEDLDGAQAEAWTAALREMAPYVRTGESQEWAFEHVRLKAELMRLDHRITGRLAAGEEPELPVMRERLKLTERLWRRVYGLGVLRHILIPERMLPSWYSVYRDCIEKGEEERIESGHMAEDA
ncbi:hypothetical protein [Paenibacillus ginsengarvi]|uniref:DUF4838 domain-containing protein n=1 Tax=Paenibacillus ginsengarvi TaxID=400777 RepID=A0A3B0C4M3_9BACL|nr:hypothetical protein [Paenibacillus ginsengarvi]RKN79144.1 hypothetical protein D7M11_20895 [Paenibacillus ginsengarvi]